MVRGVRGEEEPGRGTEAANNPWPGEGEGEGDMRAIKSHAREASGIESSGCHNCQGRDEVYG